MSHCQLCDDNHPHTLEEKLSDWYRSLGNILVLCQDVAEVCITDKLKCYWCTKREASAVRMFVANSNIFAKLWKERHGIKIDVINTDKVCGPLNKKMRKEAIVELCSTIQYVSSEYSCSITKEYTFPETIIDEDL